MNYFGSKVVSLANFLRGLHGELDDQALSLFTGTFSPKTFQVAVNRQKTHVASYGDKSFFCSETARRLFWSLT